MPQRQINISVMSQSGKRTGSKYFRHTAHTHGWARRRTSQAYIIHELIWDEKQCPGSPPELLTCATSLNTHCEANPHLMNPNSYHFADCASAAAKCLAAALKRPFFFFKFFHKTTTVLVLWMQLNGALFSIFNVIKPPHLMTWRKVVQQPHDRNHFDLKK